MKNIYAYNTKVGYISICDNGKEITEIFYGTKPRLDHKVIESPLIKEAKRQLDQYFDGTLKTFDLPLLLEGTDFQKRVWNALQEIPYGKTKSYKEIAEKVNSPKAYRAVGTANNKNPISIVIPCHRVIGSSGKLVGYGGGLDIKETLLNIEKNDASNQALVSSSRPNRHK